MPRRKPAAITATYGATLVGRAAGTRITTDEPYI
jgi:hypothetical protein